MRTKIQVQLLIFGIVAVVVGLLFVILGLRSKSKSDELQARGVSQSAKITGATVEKGSKNKKRYILTVSWGAPEELSGAFDSGTLHGSNVRVLISKKV